MATGNPLPGMNPWLEQHWGDVRHEIISRLADQIADRLPVDLFVTVQERVYVLPADGDEQQWVPDVATFDFGSDASRPSPEAGVVVATSPAGAAAAVVTPIRITLTAEPVTEGVIEIRRLSDDRPLVAAVEVFSPTNKRTAVGREQYLAKRTDYVRAGVHLVEIDLLRGGRHLVGVPAGRWRRAWDAPYKTTVRRGGPPGRPGLVVDYYPIPLRQRLPPLPVPIGPGPADAVEVDLQLPIDHVYRRGRYDRQIDYAVPPDPPLSPDDAAWAAGRVAAARSAA